MPTHSRILVWKIPWTESLVEYDWAHSQNTEESQHDELRKDVRLVEQLLFTSTKFLLFTKQ